MTGSWPLPSEEVRHLIRKAAERLLAQEESLVADIVDASHASAPDDLQADPVLSEADRTVSKANVLQWLAANVNAPGERVEPYLGPEALDLARDLVRRGLGAADLDSWRAAQQVAWKAWVRACIEIASGDSLVELLSAAHLSITAFVDDTMTAVEAAIAGERNDLISDAAARRFETATLLISGAPVVLTRAEQALGYPLTAQHLAAVLWVPSNDLGAELDPAAESLVTAVGARRRLAIVAGTATVWLWMPVTSGVDAAAIREALRTHPEVRATVGRPAAGAEGFRSSHLEAVTTQQVLAGLRSPRRVTAFDEVRLVSLMAADPVRMNAFVTDTLGALEHADSVLRETVATFVRQRFNSSRTAEALFTHRNTVDRRLNQADTLLPRPLTENPVDVAAALQVVGLRTAER